jgi:Tfp pilus assembly protein PilF
LNKKDANALYQRALCYLGKNDFRRAIADLTKVIDAAPDFAEAYRQRALAYNKSGDATRAQADEVTAADIAARAQPA